MTDINAEIEELTAKLEALEAGDPERFRVGERITHLKRVRDRPAFLVPGRYVLKQSVFNPVGDARSNRAHWRSVFEKKIDIPPGTRFVVHDDGGVYDADGRGSVLWYLFVDGRETDKSERGRNALAHNFLQSLMAAAEPVRLTFEERFYERFGSYGRLGVTVARAALRLGVDEGALFDEIDRTYDENDS